MATGFQTPPVLVTPHIAARVKSPKRTHLFFSLSSWRMFRAPPYLSEESTPSSLLRTHKPSWSTPCGLKHQIPHNFLFLHRLSDWNTISPFLIWNLSTLPLKPQLKYNLLWKSLLGFSWAVWLSIPVLPYFYLLRAVNKLSLTLPLSLPSSLDHELFEERKILFNTGYSQYPPSFLFNKHLLQEYKQRIWFQKWQK